MVLLKQIKGGFHQIYNKTHYNLRIHLKYYLSKIGDPKGCQQITGSFYPPKRHLHIIAETKQKKQVFKKILKLINKTQLCTGKLHFFFLNSSNMATID